MDACMDPFGAEDFETHIVEDTFTTKSYDVLLDSATTHTILRNKNFSNEYNISI